MNTGADDDSRSTPILALSSARATPQAAIASRPASASRANTLIPFPRLFICRPCERRDPYAAAHLEALWPTSFPITQSCGYGSLRSQGRRTTFSSFPLQSLGHLLIPPDERALLFQALLQLFYRNVARNRIA